MTINLFLAHIIIILLNIFILCAICVQLNTLFNDKNIINSKLNYFCVVSVMTDFYIFIQFIVLYLKKFNLNIEDLTTVIQSLGYYTVESKCFLRFFTIFEILFMGEIDEDEDTNKMIKSILIYKYNIAIILCCYLIYICFSVELRKFKTHLERITNNTQPYIQIV